MDAKKILIRSYQDSDVTSLIKCWNESLPYDTIGTQVFIRKVLCDGNFNPEGLLVAAGPDTKIVGFVLAIVRRTPIFGTDLEPTNGWITAFAVRPQWRRQGIGRALFEAAEGFFRTHSREEISFSPYGPNYFVPGIDAEHYPEGAAFLRAMGFERVYSCVAMDISIPLFTIPDDVRATVLQRENEGYRFEALSPRYVVGTISLAHALNAEWGSAVRQALAQGIPFDRFLVAIDPNDRVVGFCMFGAYDHSPDRFGPFGVIDSQRGKGLGKVLLYLCLDAMRAHGLHDAWFLWTGENSPAGHLYKRAGFGVTRRFTIMKKVLAQH